MSLESQGIKKQTETKGDGRTKPKETSEVHVQLVIRLEATGEVLYDSRGETSSNTPVPIDLGDTDVKGAKEAIMSMTLGERSEFMIPSKLLYGKKGGIIKNADIDHPVPPDADMEWDIELVGVDKHRLNRYAEPRASVCVFNKSKTIVRHDED
mmetsp:Transcript_17831/g.21376  ORF Transcript_17831/g.21376 Transcript_17831/m.21376 type:complete len:153 (+) Transcript_17831:126-584(+)|eukprot:CAMPEP_0197844472 /NCGR_PEP_ID=MMETSP1438-20131217/1467_1 /TAXON_ID=1461541 /ORGANISM="Pterosperma sp., Strain CCMP1384" /LENGTH=152 /DNA_ID=CAMNT_0043455277 /DNA_START=104 /DNA_END=562 /DNA_ORIENTATION=+